MWRPTRASLTWRDPFKQLLTARARSRALRARRSQVMAVWDFEAAVERRDATGGTSKRSVLEQAAKLQAWAEPKVESGAKRQKKK